MARRDIGAYVNMSPEAITAALRGLVRRGVISVRDRRYVKIIDRVGLEDAISETATTKEKATPAATLDVALPHLRNIAEAVPSPRREVSHPVCRATTSSRSMIISSPNTRVAPPAPASWPRYDRLPPPS